jgi:DNA-binding LacI/PurR family transcriptional regulator
VRFNDFQGALDATNYLIQLGHRDVWYIGDTSLPWYQVRHEAYRQAMEQAGLQARAQTFGFSEDRFTNGLLSAQAILEQRTPVSAMFCGTDQVAYGAWEALRSRGLEVPRDMSLIGFDDQREEFRIPSLTSVRVDTIEVGRQLAKMAIAKIRTKGKRHPEIIVPTTLVIRETCRPPLRQLASLMEPGTAQRRR